jgi:hypothetical protein
MTTRDYQSLLGEGVQGRQKRVPQSHLRSLHAYLPDQFARTMRE